MITPKNVDLFFGDPVAKRAVTKGVGTSHPSEPRSLAGGPGRDQGKAKTRAAKPALLQVQILEAKPNVLFTEEQRRAVRFLHFNRTVPCTECGKRRRSMWTMLYEFYAHSMGQVGIRKSPKKHKPLDEVCGDHLLAPAWPEASVAEIDKAFHEKGRRVFPNKEKKHA